MKGRDPRSPHYFPAVLAVARGVLGCLGSNPGPFCSPALGPRAGDLTFLNLGFFICKMGIIGVPPPRFVNGNVQSASNGAKLIIHA